MFPNRSPRLSNTRPGPAFSVVRIVFVQPLKLGLTSIPPKCRLRHLLRACRIDCRTCRTANLPKGIPHRSCRQRCEEWSPSNCYSCWASVRTRYRMREAGAAKRYAVQVAVAVKEQRPVRCDPIACPSEFVQDVYSRSLSCYREGERCYGDRCE